MRTMVVGHQTNRDVDVLQLKRLDLRGGAFGVHSGHQQALVVGARRSHYHDALCSHPRNVVGSL